MTFSTMGMNDVDLMGKTVVANPKKRQGVQDCGARQWRVACNDSTHMMP